MSRYIKSNRNYGVDLLRIVSMLMIVILHILSHGKILSSLKPFEAGYEVTWFLECAAFCAVNCYALISGYVGFSAKFRYKNIVLHYLQMLFYTILIPLIMSCFLPDIMEKDMFVRSLFPVCLWEKPKVSMIFSDYWYFTAYFCMFFFIPFFNRIVELFDQKLLKRFIFTIVIITSVLPTFAYSDVAKMNVGYSAVWLGIMYIIGAYIRRYGFLRNIRSRWLVLGYFLCVAFSWGMKWLFEWLSFENLKEIQFGNFFVKYTSPTTVLEAVLLLVVFSRMRFNPTVSKVIQSVSVTTLGVYFIHDHPYIRENIIGQLFAGFVGLEPMLLVLSVIGSAIVIFIICSLIDQIRRLIFYLLRIQPLLDKLETELKGIFAKKHA